MDRRLRQTVRMIDSHSGTDGGERTPRSATAARGADVPSHPGTVQRHRLARGLGSGATAALTLVEAPAGYGKTTAVRGWLDGTPGIAVWVTLDERDNDAVRLWTAVAASAEQACPGVGQRALELLRTPHAAVTGAIDALAGALERSGTDAVVVLDDLQLIQDEHCQQSLDYAIEAMPRPVQPVVIARSVPRLIRIARLRTQGRLVEIGAGALAFTRAETRTVIQAVAGTTIGDAALDAVMDRTEGWPAAVYLAALHMREDGPDAVMRVLDGSHRHVADYLAREVVHALAPDTRRLLLRGSALTQLSGELCDAVLGTTDGARRLRDLERSNLLVTELRERRGGTSSIRCCAIIWRPNWRSTSRVRRPRSGDRPSRGHGNTGTSRTPRPTRMRSATGTRSRVSWRRTGSRSYVRDGRQRLRDGPPPCRPHCSRSGRGRWSAPSAPGMPSAVRRRPSRGCSSWHAARWTRGRRAGRRRTGASCTPVSACTASPT